MLLTRRDPVAVAKHDILFVPIHLSFGADDSVFNDYRAPQSRMRLLYKYITWQPVNAAPVQNSCSQNVGWCLDRGPLIVIWCLGNN